MVGVILILIALLLFFPVSIIMSGAGLSAVIGAFLKTSVDSQFDETEDLEISEANPY